MRLPAGDEVEPFIELGEEARDLGRVVLQVAVDGHDDVALSVREPGRERGGLAEVAPQPDDSHVVLRVVQARQGAERPVGRAVVDEHGLPRLIEWIERRLQLVEEERDRPLLVMNGHDNGDHGG